MSVITTESFSSNSNGNHKRNKSKLADPVFVQWNAEGKERKIRKANNGLHI